MVGHFVSSQRLRFMEKTFARYNSLNKSEKGEFVVKPLRSSVDKVTSEGFEAKEVRGVFWPRAIWDEFHGKSVKSEDLTSFRGAPGVLQPKVPGQILPIGVVKLHKTMQEKVEQRDTFIT